MSDSRPSSASASAVVVRDPGDERVAVAREPGIDEDPRQGSGGGYTCKLDELFACICNGGGAACLGDGKALCQL